MGETDEPEEVREEDTDDSIQESSKHVVLGPLSSEGGGFGVESGSLIQWNPDVYFDDNISYATTCGCPFNWKSRIRSPKLVWDWAKANKREFMAAVTVTLTLVCMMQPPRPTHQKD